MPEMRNKHVNLVPAEIFKMVQIFSPKLVQGLLWTIFHQSYGKDQGQDFLFGL